MKIGGIIGKYLQKKKVKDSQLKAVENEMRINKLAQDRLKTTQERELEEYMENNRQQMIKQKLAKMKKKEMDNDYSKNPLNEKNIFKNKDNMFANQKSIFMNNNKGMLKRGGHQYFK